MLAWHRKLQLRCVAWYRKLLTVCVAWYRKLQLFVCVVSEAAYCFVFAWYRKLQLRCVAHRHSLPQLPLASNISMLQVCSDTTTTHVLLLHTCCTSTMLGYNQLNLSAAHRHSLPQLPLASNISLLQVCSDTTTTQFLLPHTCCLATTNFKDRLQTTFDTPRLIKITAHGSNKHRSLVTTEKKSAHAFPQNLVAGDRRTTHTHDLFNDFSA